MFICILRRKIYMKMSEEMAEIFEECYTYVQIFALIKYSYVLIQVAHFWFNHYIKNIKLQARFKQ